MLRGLYTAAAGMITQQRVHDTVTNNISNMNTPGYKQVNTVERSFPEMLIHLMGTETKPKGQIGRLNTGVFAEESMPQFTQGDLTETRSATDFALSSDLQAIDPATNAPIAFDANGKAVLASGEVVYKPQAFFAVQNAAEETRYTRDGRFKLDADGYLLTSMGARVLGVNDQPIQFNTVQFSSLRLNDKGEWVDANTGAVNNAIPQLKVMKMTNPNLLVREGDGNYKFTNTTDEATAEPILPEEAATVRQGYLERSNVDATQSAVDMMAAARAYEANQKIIQFYDRSLDKAVNEIGRI